MSKRRKRGSVGQTFATLLFWTLALMVIISILTATEASGDRSNPCPDYDMAVSNYGTCWGIDGQRNYEWLEQLLGGE